MNYALRVNSDDKNAKPIAVIKNGKDQDFIDLVESRVSYPIIESKHEVFPTFNKDEDQNLRIYVAGQSGCGKSYFCGKLMELYHRLNEDKKIYLFSTIDFDKNYDSNPNLLKDGEPVFIRYELNKENAEMLKELKEDDVEDSLCVFDDYLLFDPKLKKIVDSIKDILLKRGRHHGIDLAIINDKARSGRQSLCELNHCNYIVTFPGATNPKELNAVLSDYVGLEGSGIRMVKKLPTRWVCFHKNYPKYAVYQNGAVLFS